ncbi:MAG: hypothetical protein MUF62_13450 [Chitinophagaceae bacterium]|jgi:hypothetical protein|nr:hypothetical protein [Chitinophagaceae bacterium]
MRTALLALLLGLTTVTVSAQSLPDFASIRLQVKEDYDDNANQAALTAATYLLTKPLSDPQRPAALAYVLRWMTGSPDYSFSLDAKAMRFTKSNDDLLGLYMAGMARFALENKDKAADAKAVNMGGLQHVANYASHAANGVKLNGELKKLIKASQDGKLAAYLGG